VLFRSDEESLVAEVDIDSSSHIIEDSNLMNTPCSNIKQTAVIFSDIKRLL